MLYEIPELKIEGNSLLKNVKLNTDLRQKLARLKCDFLNKDSEIRMDHSISWSNISLEFPQYAFHIRGKENLRDIYYEIHCKYSIMKKVWSFSGVVKDTNFSWNKLNILEAYQRVLEAIALASDN